MAEAFKRSLFSARKMNAKDKHNYCANELPRWIASLAPPIPPHDESTVCQRSMLTLGTDPIYEYQHLKAIINGNRFHWGQLKLFASELEFIAMAIRCYGYDLFSRIDGIVYAGAADGRHLPLLIDLLPHTNWWLYDPAQFDNNLIAYAATKTNIHLLNEYFTDKVATEFTSRKILFISDVRRVVHCQLGHHFRDCKCVDQKIAELKRDDHELQASWVKIMKPLCSMLKFALPYEHTSMDYFDGLIMTQAYAPENSTECRIIVDGSLISSNVTYNTRQYEETMCRFNRVEREYCFTDENDFMEFCINVDGHDRDVSIDCKQIANPPFMGHDAWRLTEILLHFVLTMKSVEAFAASDVECPVLGVTDRTTWKLFRGDLIGPLDGHHLEKSMNDIMLRFLRLSSCDSYDDHIIKIKLRRSNFD